MFCGACGQRIADDSRFCKFCGIAQTAPAESPSANMTTESADKPKDKTGRIIGWTLAAILLVIVLADVGKSPELTSGSASDSSGADLKTSDASSTAPDVSATSNWSYSTDEDKVRSGTMYYATTTSTNSIHQDFPYSSNTTMDMTLRKSRAYGTDVMLQISSGQMMCPSYEGCTGSVRFDGGPAQKLRFNGPADNSDDVVFVEGARGFISKLQRAKKVVIEKTIYQGGAPQFEFNVQGLKWEH